MLGNGVGKARADSLGNARPTLKWKVPIISAGEISIAEKLAEGGLEAKAGQEMRLLDIQADGRRFGAFDDLHGAAAVKCADIRRNTDGEGSILGRY